MYIKPEVAPVIPDLIKSSERSRLVKILYQSITLKRIILFQLQL